MGKAKMLGGAAIVLGLILLLLAMLLVHGAPGQDMVSAFIDFVVAVWLPVTFITLAVIGFIIGIMLLIYG